MSKEIGRLDHSTQKINFECCVEWTMENIFSFTKKDEFYDSPKFSFLGSKWNLKIFPNGKSNDIRSGWIHLHLMKAGGEGNLKSPINVNSCLGLKNATGTIEIIINCIDCIFNENISVKEFNYFLYRPNLTNRKHELAPSGALTVTCTIRMADILGSTSSLTELSEDLNNMLLSKEYCDATLKVQGKEFPVHKSVLAARSKVFKTMFQADIKDIDDCHPEAFKDFHKYIYCGQFENSSGDVVELYKIARKYRVESLQSASVQYMLNNMSVDNVLDVSALGHLFNESQLMHKSQEFLGEHFADVLLTVKWGEYFKKNPNLVNELLTNVAKGMKDKEKI